MPTRKKQIESIIESMHAVRRKMLVCSAAKSHASSGEPSFTPSQWMVLTIVMKKDGIGVKEIAETLRISSSAVTQLIDGLVEKGCLLREDHAKDRRALKVKLSARYKKRAVMMKSRMAEGLTTMFRALSDRELAQYAALNRKIAEGAVTH